jgi:toxin FitB
MHKFLCDTNVISEIMRKKPAPRVGSWFSSLPVPAIALSIITIEELVFGLRRKRLYEKEAWLRRFTASACRIIEVTAEDVFWAGEKRGSLSSEGRTIFQADALIAAAARRGGLVLATRNIRDFNNFGIPLLNPWEV